MNTPSLRTELWIALIVVLLSLLLLPGLIYAVGSVLFGRYEAGVHGMYAAQLRGLLQLHWAPWVLSAGPALCVAVLRALWRWTSAPANTAVARPRREPHVGA